jgi:hypothetical protein
LTLSPKYQVNRKIANWHGLKKSRHVRDRVHHSSTGMPLVQKPKNKDHARCVEHVDLSTDLVKEHKLDKTVETVVIVPLA